MGILGKMRDLTPPGYRKHLVAAYLAAYPALFGINVEKLDGGKVRLSKGGRAAVVAGSDFIPVVARNFEGLFSVKGMEYSGSEIDFTREVRLFGFSVKTNAQEALWVGPILTEYNKHRPLLEGEVVFDCGAYHGIYSLIAARAVGGQGKVYCFEPDDDNYDVVRQNLERNGVKNVELVKLALWNCETELSFVKNLDHSSRVEFSGSSRGGKGMRTVIKTTTIASFCEKHGLAKPDVVKMDIEGAELEAIGASLGFLKARGVDFAIASYHIRDGEPTCIKLEKMLSSVGYSARTEKNSAGELITYASPAKG